MKGERELVESLESFPKVDCVDSDVYCVITSMHPTVFEEVEEKRK